MQSGSEQVFGLDCIRVGHGEVLQNLEDWQRDKMS